MAAAMTPLLDSDGFGAGVPGERPRASSRLRVRGGEGVNMQVIGFAAAGTFCFVLCVVGAVLFSTSAAVPPNFVGIKYNLFTKEVNTDMLFEPGRYFSGPLITYTLFPTNVQNVDLFVVSRTKDGFPLNLGVAFQYQLVKEDIMKVWSVYNINYEFTIKQKARSALMKAVSQYSALDFFKKREAILLEMQSLLGTTFKDVWSLCWGIQFNDVQQKPAFEEQLLRTQLQKWYAVKMKVVQEVSAVKAHIAVLKAEFDKNISIVSALSEKKCSVILTTSRSHATVYQRESEANATLAVERAEAAGGLIVKEAQAKSDLFYANMSARGDAIKLREEATARNVNTKLEAIRLDYWRRFIGLSKEGLLLLKQILSPSYKNLEEMPFLFGFNNSYASAAGGSRTVATEAQLAAIRGAAFFEAEESAKLSGA